FTADKSMSWPNPMNASQLPVPTTHYSGQMDGCDRFQQPFTTDTAQTSILDYLDGLRRRKWLVIASVVCTLALAALATWMMTPVYEAVTRIAIYRETQGDLNLKEPVADRATEDADYTV